MKSLNIRLNPDQFVQLFSRYILAINFCVHRRSSVRVSTELRWVVRWWAPFGLCPDRDNIFIEMGPLHEPSSRRDEIFVAFFCPEDDGWAPFRPGWDD
jgi:hypothetical protein